MSRRSEVLKPFLDRRGFMEDRIREGIELYRKGYGRLQFKDGEGHPLAGARVRLRQLSHDFKYGANLFMLDEFPSQEQNELYRQQFAETFNLATLPFYWRDLEPEQGKPRYGADSPRVYRRPAPDLCLDYCESQGIMPKAHCLNYANFIPAWAFGDADMEKRLLEKRFRELGARYSSRIRDWEVTNETLFGLRVPRFSDFYNQDDYVEWSFDMARRYFPCNRLLINEAHCRIWDKDHFTGNRSPYYMIIERAQRQGCRIDSIGMQFHMFSRREQEAEETAQYYDPQRIYDVMDTYAKLGCALQITETTIPAYSTEVEDEALQAEIIRNLYSMWFSHPAMEAIVYWNLVDGFAAFAPQGDMTAGENYYHGGLIRYDFTPKPAFQMIRDLFHKEWHTELDLETEGESLEFKGFYGNYEVEASVQGKTVRQDIHLGRGMNNSFTVTVL